jgi:hypothetical protein
MTQPYDATIRSPIIQSSVASIPKANFFDTLTVLSDVLIPTLAKGVIIRRPTVVAIAERLDLDRQAIRRMQRLRNKYGSGPRLFRIPGRSFAVILDPNDVHQVLSQSPEPFATATVEKRAALAHFEPKNVLISHGNDRANRRRYNEEVLDTSRPVHRLAGTFLEIVATESSRLVASARRRGVLAWGEFSDAWFRIVRRVAFGNAAGEDYQLSGMMAKLRSAANWAFLWPQRNELRGNCSTGSVVISIAPNPTV